MDFGIVAPFIASVLASGLTYILTKKRSDADTRKIKAEAFGFEIKNAEGVLNFWKKIAEDLTDRVTELTEEVTQLRAENRKMGIEMKKLERIILDSKHKHQ